MRNYPKDPQEFFETTNDKLWIKNNVMLPYDPSKKPKDYLLLLSVNLHTYQEKEQEAKFSSIVQALYDLRPDVVLLQECAQNKEATIIKKHYDKEIKKDNMAHIICSMLRDNHSINYDYYWDWSHYGWNEWEEGVAILTPHKIIRTESKYVTTNQTKTFWKSRNIAMATVDITSIGKINFFSIHTGWWNDKPDPFNTQFENIIEWEESIKNGAIATILAGDFNIEAGSEGYTFIEDKDKYIDIYRKANPHGFYDPTIGGKIDGWEKGMPTGKRIDYIFINKDADFTTVMSQRIFTKKSYGRVSDHTGVYAVLKKGKNPQ